MKDYTINWKLKLFQILRCFGEQEGTQYSEWWESYGVSNDQKKQILEEYYDWVDSNDE